MKKIEVLAANLVCAVKEMGEATDAYSIIADVYAVEGDKIRLHMPVNSFNRLFANEETLHAGVLGKPYKESIVISGVRFFCLH